ncbi:MAG: hypothetical protein JKY19_05560 [Alcanivoracaceae bacterium]|nr:hypothetical protein [Alcanivoracaceae bacterium]
MAKLDPVLIALLLQVFFAFLVFLSAGTLVISLFLLVALFEWGDLFDAQLTKKKDMQVIIKSFFIINYFYEFNSTRDINTLLRILQ